MSERRGFAARWPIVALSVIWFVAPALAQGSATAPAKGGAPASKGETGVPNALQGFSRNKDEPVQIEAATLEVRDKEKMAVFTGNVVVITQGANVLKGERLVVDLTTNFAKVEGGRVQGLFSTGRDDKPAASGSGNEGQKPAVRNKPTALPSPSQAGTN